METGPRRVDLRTRGKHSNNPYIQLNVRIIDNGKTMLTFGSDGEMHIYRRNDKWNH